MIKVYGVKTTIICCPREKAAIPFGRRRDWMTRGAGGGRKTRRRRPVTRGTGGAAYRDSAAASYRARDDVTGRA